jgi:hypothetical protein
MTLRNNNENIYNGCASGITRFWALSIVRTMENVQKHSNSECYTPSSEPFRIYLDVILAYVSVNEKEILRKLQSQ